MYSYTSLSEISAESSKVDFADVIEIVFCAIFELFLGRFPSCSVFDVFFVSGFLRVFDEFRIFYVFLVSEFLHVSNEFRELISGGIALAGLR